MALVSGATGKRSVLSSVLKVDTEGRHNLRGLLHLAMSDTSAKPERSWQDIVAEAARASRETTLGVSRTCAES